LSGVAWTRLSSEPIWEASARAHRPRLTRIYHVWDRVIRLYARAETVLNLPYDRALDLAILTHSVQIDIGGDRRSRSVAWLRTHAGPDEPVDIAAGYILAGPYRSFIDPRLPLLELSDLAFPETGHQALRDMQDQIMLLTRLSADEVALGLSDELNRIRRALAASLHRISRPPERDLATAIILGCEQLSPQGRDRFI